MVPSLAKFADTMVLVSFPRLGPATPFKFRPPIIRSFDPVIFVPACVYLCPLAFISWWDLIRLLIAYPGLPELVVGLPG